MEFSIRDLEFQLFKANKKRAGKGKDVKKRPIKSNGEWRGEMVLSFLYAREIHGTASRLLNHHPSTTIIPYSSLFPSLGPIEDVVLVGFASWEGEVCLLSINQSAIEFHNFWCSPSSPITKSISLAMKLGNAYCYCYCYC